MKTFNSALELAKWLCTQSFPPAREEQLMHEGCAYNKIHGIYLIEFTVHDLQYMHHPLPEYSLN